MLYNSTLSLIQLAVCNWLWVPCALDVVEMITLGAHTIHFIKSSRDFISHSRRLCIRQINLRRHCSSRVPSTGPAAYLCVCVSLLRPFSRFYGIEVKTVQYLSFAVFVSKPSRSFHEQCFICWNAFKIPVVREFVLCLLFLGPLSHPINGLRKWPISKGSTRNVSELGGQ